MYTTTPTIEDPLVSILIPFKNTAQFITECMDSIQQQTYTNWEVSAVNDHSTDESNALMNSYARKDARIKVFPNNGHGIIPALRTAYAAANGSLITRMDSDDIMLPHKLQLLTENLLRYGKGHVALGQVRYFSDRGISEGYSKYEKWLNQLTQTGSNYVDIYKECVIPSPCWMVFKTDLDRCGAFQPDRYPEDYDLTFRFYEQGIRCIPCGEILHLWRDYDTRTSRTHIHYAQNYFLDIKLHYFLKLHHDTSRPLVLWGAGNKGKTIAKMLIGAQIEFYWLCDNLKKIGKSIYGKEMHHFNVMEKWVKPQSIITVANPRAQDGIKTHLDQLGQKPISDYFFFC